MKKATNLDFKRFGTPPPPVTRDTVPDPVIERFNAYSCDVCGKTLVTVDRVAGVTPMMLRCRKTPTCRGSMRSHFYNLAAVTDAVPEMEWRKPTQKEYAKMDRDMRQYVDSGGLVLYSIHAGAGEEK